MNKMTFDLNIWHGGSTSYRSSSKVKVTRQRRKQELSSCCDGRPWCSDNRKYHRNADL